MMTKEDLYLEKIRQLQEELRSVTENFNTTIGRLNSTILSLQGTIDTLTLTNRSLLASVSSKETALKEREEDRGRLEDKVRNLNRMVGNKSERTIVSGKPSNAPTPKERGNNKAKRSTHPEAEVEIVELEPDSPEYNPEIASFVGVTDVIRYHYRAGRIIKRIYREKAYKQDGMFHTGHAPAAVAPGSNFDSSVVADICKLRYELSMPVERIIKLYTDQGFDMAKSTAHNLLKLGDKALEGLYGVLRNAVLSDNYQNWDETFHRTLDPDLEKGSKKAYLWEVIGRGMNLIFYYYEGGSRKADIPKDLLKGRSVPLYLQSDAYSAYKSLGPGVIRIACLAHIRRYFTDLRGDKDADEVSGLIDSLYRKEHRHVVGKGWSVRQHLRYRKEYSRRILADIKEKLNGIRNSKACIGQLEKAVNHMLDEWEPIENIFRTGECDLDNNIAERYNRYISLSRKNSLFFGSHAGAERAAMYYSLVCSCRMQNVNLTEYMEDVINKVNLLGESATDEKLRMLLPDKWKKP